MNEEYSHLNPVGNEALEARIIAWVLGEASSFEAAELEKICEQAPEWRVFQRRMLAVHQLLGEATVPRAANDWSLSQEKRGKLDEVIGSVERIAKPVRKRSRWWQRTVGLAATLILGAIVVRGVTGKVGSSKKDIIAFYNVQPEAAVTYHEESRSMKAQSPASAPSSSNAKVIASAPSTRDNVVWSDADAAPLAPGEKSNLDAMAGAPATDAPADPFSREAQPEVATSYYRNAPVKEEATRVADGDGVPTLEEIPGMGRLFSGKPTAPAPAPAAAPASETAVVAGALRVEDRQSGALGLAVPAESAITNRTDAANQPSTGYGNSDGFGDGWGSEQSGGAGGGGFSRSGTGTMALGEQQWKGKVVEKKKAQSDFDYPTEYQPPTVAQNGTANGGALPKLSGQEEIQFNGRTPGAAGQTDSSYAAMSDGLKRFTKGQSDESLATEGQERAQLLTDVDKDWDLQGLTKEANEGEGEGEAAKALEKNRQVAKDLEIEKAKEQKMIPELAEMFTSQEPYSTFSLRVSDNSFRVAQAAMARNQRPAAESVRVEEFYNAFDYGDPMPTAKEPVAAAMEQSAHPILPQRNLLRIGMRTAAAGRGAGQPLHLTLLVDRSGSMSRADRSDALAASIKELTNLLTEQDQISVIGFSRTPRLLVEKMAGNQTASIIEILARTPSDGGTNLEEALKVAELVAKRNHLAGAQNRVLLMTDGAANLGNADPARLAAWVKNLRQQNIAFDIAGIGTDGLNDPLLVEMARNGNGRYYVMNDAAQAKQDFAAQLAGAFRPAAENVKVQVQFNPQRVGKYKLIGFEKDRLRTEDFRNDKVDAAEMAAAEAGQALYQVELLPEGSGDIGEVSVRFRDVATQQMVERKWTIRYEPSAPAFDRASPTMQLAGLAMLTAEKLQGGESASQIRFAELQEPQQRVRNDFSSNKRVGELLEMMQQLNP